MKVLLLNPFLTVFSDDPGGVSPALGLGYLSAYLDEHGIDVKVLDIAAEGLDNVRKVGDKVRYGLEEDEIKERIRSYDPQVVGITCQSTLHARDAHETAKIVKSVDPDILVVMGGAHPSSNPKEVMKDENIDIVVKGEGEVTLLKIVQKAQKGSSLNEISGTLVRRNGKIVKNEPRPLVEDLDELPFPARRVLPMEIYLRELRENTNYTMRDRVTTMITSRGCPGNCIYCAVRTVWGRRWRPRSPENVVDEIEVLIEDYGIEEVHFIDDSMSVDMERLKDICDEIIERDLDIKWTTPNGIALWLLDKELIRKMKDAGCYRLTFGLESGNETILHKFIRKNYQYDKAQEIIKYASQIGLWTVGTFIIGFPYETREQIEDTIEFAISTRLDFAVFYIANPFPGTEMYDIYEEENLLSDTGVLDVVRGCSTKNFSHEELKELQDKAFSRFMQSRIRTPWRFLTKLRSWDDLLYFLKIFRNASKLFLRPAVFKEKGIAALWE